MAEIKLKQDEIWSPKWSLTLWLITATEFAVCCTVNQIKEHIGPMADTPRRNASSHNNFSRKHRTNLKLYENMHQECFLHMLTHHMCGASGWRLKITILPGSMKIWDVNVIQIGFISRCSLKNVLQSFCVPSGRWNFLQQLWYNRCLASFYIGKDKTVQTNQEISCL